jgi:hypothetical protein
MPAIEACYFIEEAPEFDYRKGLFHVRQRIGDRTFERVMSPHVFMVALRRAAESPASINSEARTFFRSSDPKKRLPAPDIRPLASGGL